MRRPGFVYLLASAPHGTLYLGVTGDLARRVEQHRSGAVEGFAKKWRCRTLVWFAAFDDLQDARARELQMKKWKRAWKVEAIEAANPEWRDLSSALLT